MSEQTTRMQQCNDELDKVRELSQIGKLNAEAMGLIVQEIHARIALLQAESLDRIRNLLERPPAPLQ